MTLELPSPVRYDALAHDLADRLAPALLAGGLRPRVGTDVQAVAAVRESLTGPLREAYLARLFTRTEQLDCGVGSTTYDGVVAESLAARFAVKEAVVKVLRPDGTGVRPPWTDIEVRRGPGGAPDLVLTGTAARHAAYRGLACWTCSFTHDDGWAFATVVALEITAH